MLGGEGPSLGTDGGMAPGHPMAKKTGVSHQGGPECNMTEPS
jgi:hypothetical protein